MNKAEKIRHGNIESWKKKREAFFKTNPRCSVCKEKLTNYTETDKCWRCRAAESYDKFMAKNPDYQKKYQHERHKNRKK